MVLELYSIFDKKSGAYTAPFSARAPGEAVRTFSLRASDKNHPIGATPEDYALYHMGKFDDNSGEFNLLKKPEFLHHGIDVVRPSEV